MKSILRVASIFLCVFFVSVINSNALDTKGYIGFNYYFSEFETDFDTDNFDANLGVVGIKLGVDIIDYLGVEARYGFGVADDTTYALGFKIDVEADYYYGVYLRPKYKINQLQIYGLLGYTKAQIEIKTPLGSFDEDDTDFSYGAGLEWFFNDDVSASIEYMQLMDESDYEVESINLGVTCYF